MTYEKPIITSIVATPNPVNINQKYTITVTCIDAEMLVEIYAGEIYAGEDIE